MVLKSVIFDVDGTLADTEKDGHLWAFNHVFQQWNLPFRWSISLYRDLLKIPGGQERLTYYQTQHPERVSLSAAQIAEIHQIKTSLFIQRVWAGAIPLRFGVRSLVSECYERHIPVAIATTTQYANVEALLLTHFGPQWRKIFPVVVAGDHVAKKKPHPCVYHQCLQQLGVAPDEAVALEDSAVGLTAAQQAGIPTVVTMNIWTYHQRFTGALGVLTGLGTHKDPAFGRGPRHWGRYCVTPKLLEEWLTQ